MTQRMIIDIMRHGKKAKGPDGKSLDCLSVEGAREAMDHGAELYAGYNASDIVVYSSPLVRAQQTGHCLMMGAGIPVGVISASGDGVATTASDYLGLATIKNTMQLPKDMGYGSAWIADFLARNGGAEHVIGAELGGFIREALTSHLDNDVQEENIVVGVSHGPKVEIGYGNLVGIREREAIAELAAGELDGVRLKIDARDQGNDIQHVTASYRGGPERRIDPAHFASVVHTNG